MLSDIKKNISGSSVREVTEQLAAIKQEQQKQISTLQEELKITKQSHQQLEKEVIAMLGLVQQTSSSTQYLQQSLEEAMTDLKLVSSTIQNTLVSRISDDLSLLRKTIEEKLGGSEQLKKEVEATTLAITKELQALRADIVKLASISSSIKKEDFELNKVAQHLLKEDKEKLRLMNEVDRLQRLVGSMRRKQ